jgi:hypothetical protein
MSRSIVDPDRSPVLPVRLDSLVRLREMRRFETYAAVEPLGPRRLVETAALSQVSGERRLGIFTKELGP